MKQTLIAILLFVGTLLSDAEAQPDWKLDLFADDQMSNCAIEYAGPGIIQIHAFHTGDTPSTCRDLPGCASMRDTRRQALANVREAIASGTSVSEAARWRERQWRNGGAGERV